MIFIYYPYPDYDDGNFPAGTKQRDKGRPFYIQGSSKQDAYNKLPKEHQKWVGPEGVCDLTRVSKSCVLETLRWQKRVVERETDFLNDLNDLIKDWKEKNNWIGL